MPGQVGGGGGAGDVLDGGQKCGTGATDQGGHRVAAGGGWLDRAEHVRHRVHDHGLRHVVHDDDVWPGENAGDEHQAGPGEVYVVGAYGGGGQDRIGPAHLGVQAGQQELDAAGRELRRAVGQVVAA